MRKPLKKVKKNEKKNGKRVRFGHLNKGGVLPTGALTFTFSIVIFVTFLILMFGNIQASAPASNANSYISGAGNINETTNPIGITSLASDFAPLSWIILGVLVVAAMIIGAVLIPSWI
jgi:hypothetical protein